MDFSGKKELVKLVQKQLNLVADGKDGKLTWQALVEKLVPKETEVAASIPSLILSEKAFKLILKYEVGGGQSYYDRALKKPCYPGGASGVTIGIGYDLGYNNLEQFSIDWKDLDRESFDKLKRCLGATSSRAKSMIGDVRSISIPWDLALTVFQNNTLPRFINETKKAFPGSDKLHPDAFGALVSLVFNRGGSTTGSSRSEMLNIRNAIKDGREDIYEYIANQIISMKRLWVGKGLDGLLTRRNEEAALVKSCS
jgi:GH24 family phage-related lysozyme (muramidase)